MKYNFLIVIGFVWAVASYGQKIEITKGPIFDTQKILQEMGLSKMDIARGLGANGASGSLFFNPSNRTTYAGFGINKDAYHFAVLDNYLEFSSAKKLTSEYITGLASLHSFTIINDQMYVIFSQKHEEHDAFTTYVNEVSKDMVVLGSPIKLQSFKQLKDEGEQISVTTSDNEQYRLITRTHKVSGKEQVKFTFKVVDNQFAEVWTKTILLPTMTKHTDINSIDLDNKGNVYIMVTDRSVIDGQAVLHTYFGSTDTFRSHILGLSKGTNFGAKLSIVDGERPLVFGLNRDGGREVFYFVDELKTDSQKLEHLSKGLMPDDFFPTSNTMGFSLAHHWAINQIISLDNENLIASVEGIIQSSKYNLRHTYNTYIISIDKTGKENWIRTIQKKQVVIAGLEGHQLVPAGDKTIIIYNDHVKNTNLKPEDSKVTPFKSKDATVLVQEIDGSGLVKKYPLFQDRELADYALNFEYFSEIEEGLYYSNCMNIQGMLNITTINLTLKISE